MTSTASSSPPTVAIVGCGPGGMSFLHALALRKEKCEETNDLEGLAKLPVVTIFERASEAGGVWRSSSNSGKEKKIVTPTMGSNLIIDDKENNKVKEEDTFDTSEITPSETSSLSSKSSSSGEDAEYVVEGTYESSTNMYEALWTNGPSPAIEFFDYSFQEHFKKEVPLFLPRRDVLDYLYARYTRKNPNFFDSVKFNTTVEHVKYDEVLQKFCVTTSTGEGLPVENLFDKCIWAAGENGGAKIPTHIRNLLRKGRYQGRDVHSCEAGKFLGSVEDKKIMIIGDSLSAEDLTLQAIKLGAKKVYILPRSGEGVCSYTASWPMRKAQVLCDKVITGVSKDGRGIQVSEAEYDVVTEQQTLVDGGKTRELTDISMIIYCTGYRPNFNMLDPTLCRPFTKYDGDDEESLDDEDDFDYLKNFLPENWKMSDNVLTEEVNGHVEPSADTLDTYQDELINIVPGIYKGLLMSNTSMMYLSEGVTDAPLHDIDVNAWLLLAYLMEDTPIPSLEQMKETHREIVRQGMQIPNVREMIDMNYRQALEEAALEQDDDEEDPWWESVEDDRAVQLQLEASRFNFLNHAQDMAEAKYPLQFITAEGKLNSTCESFIRMLIEQDHFRELMPTTKETRKWLTFRDMDTSGGIFKSLITGTPVASLGKHWMDLEDDVQLQ